eukprot:tig00000057_g129.t1
MWGSTMMFQPPGFIPRFFEERKMFYIENKSGYYGAFAYTVARAAVDSPLVLLDLLCMTSIYPDPDPSISYWPAGFTAADNGGRYVTMVFVMWLIYFASYGCTRPSS